MNAEEYPEWAETLAAVADSTGTLLVIGGIDTGKTTLCTLLANAVAARGATAAVLDADIGQSEIGPPACVGLGEVSAPIGSLSEVRAAGLAFVGSTAPRGCMLEHVSAIHKLADLALRGNPALVIVDTTGHIQGQGAARLKEAKAAILRPSNIFALQREDECESILRVLECAAHCRVHRLPVPAVIRRKPPSFRAQRRAARFAGYFQHSEIRPIPFERTVFSHTWLNSAPPTAPHILKFLSRSAGVPVRYAEQSGRFLGLVTESDRTADLTVIHETLKPESISVSPIHRLNHLLVGLSDGSRLLGVGTIANVDLTRRVLEVQTPVKSVSNVKLVHFGIIRIRPDGKELGTLRPGDI